MMIDQFRMPAEYGYFAVHRNPETFAMSIRVVQEWGMFIPDADDETLRDLLTGLEPHPLLLPALNNVVSNASLIASTTRRGAGNLVFGAKPTLHRLNTLPLNLRLNICDWIPEDEVVVAYLGPNSAKNRILDGPFAYVDGVLCIRPLWEDFIRRVKVSECPMNT